MEGGRNREVGSTNGQFSMICILSVYYSILSVYYSKLSIYYLCTIVYYL